MPQSRHRTPIALLVALLALAFAGVAQAQEPAPEPVPVAPPNSTVAGVDISGMDAATALATVEAAFAQPIVIRVGKRVFRVRNSRIEATFAIEEAVTEAMARPNGGNTPVEAEYSASKVARVASNIERLAGRRGKPARWVVRRTPRIVRPRPGITVSKARVIRQIERAVAKPALRPEQETLPLVRVNTDATVRTLGYVITISKGQRVLRLWAPYKGKARVARKYRIAVGAPAFPTPTGRFTIVTMQKNPWWYPPASDWAKGEEPVPPGPSNPLGTRWMGLDRLDIGIHGTPDSGSIGGYASHGCVRMLIHQAEALFAKVSVGTPVLIF